MAKIHISRVPTDMARHPTEKDCEFHANSDISKPMMKTRQRYELWIKGDVTSKNLNNRTVEKVIKQKD